ncbi:hypothetical protein [Thermincola potens]|nr:hypothetical protein [Thermincola potens]
MKTGLEKSGYTPFALMFFDVMPPKSAKKQFFILKKLDKAKKRTAQK